MVDTYTYYDHSLVESKLVSVFDKPSTMIMVFLSFCFTLNSIGASGFVGLLRKIWKRKFMPLVGGSNIIHPLSCCCQLLARVAIRLCGMGNHLP